MQTGVTYYLESARADNFDPKLVEKRFVTYVDQTVDNIREVLTYYTGSSCSVCVKLFIGRHPLEEQREFPHNYIRTFCRDSVSRAYRRKVDDKFDTKAFPYTQNTGFSRIIDSPDDSTYFYNNDLKALGQEYRNQNPNWSKYYNATAIAAIKDPDQPKGSGIIAFLCVDTMEGRFDDHFCKHLLMLVSNNLFYAFTNAFMINRGRR